MAGKQRKAGRPAQSIEGRENQMINKAIDLVEKQIEDGTASSQVLTHYLKLGTTREKLEQEKLRRQNILLEAQNNQIQSASRMEELAANALNAFKGYAGIVDEPGDDDG